ncbi:tellurite resistance protein, partial [Pectobacterium wasabiae]
MERIVIPANNVHTRTTPFWTKETAPASIWQRHLDAGTRQAVYPRMCVMQGTIRYYGYADETNSEPVETLTIEAGQFGVFPAEKWHRIEALSDDT